ncbi:MAG TPA: ATP-binding cassette domain-containing protein [Candidatus Anoxymicrobiaceae bacterium]
MRELVRAKRASRSYRAGSTTVTALEDASFVVTEGAQIALAGPSGSGKTTMLHLAAGLDLPSDGSVTWPALGQREKLRPGLVSMAFQGPSLIPQLTVAENVALPLLFMGISESEALKQAEEFLGLLEAADIAGNLPEEISGGQSQRADLARAMITGPALILADEPTGQQDSEGARRLMDTILDFALEIGAALLVATHDSAVADLLETRWSIADGHLRTE